MLSQALKLESARALMDAALAGKSWEELQTMRADLERAGRQNLAGVHVGDPAKCEATRGQAHEGTPASSFDDEGRYVATDEDIPF